MKDMIKRINQLARKEKVEALTKEEKEEQKKLREEYIKNFRSSFQDTLMQVKVVDPLGNDVTPEKLLQKQKKKKN